MFFISDSFAQEAASVAATPDFSFASFVPLLAIFGIFYLLIIRPQSKKMKEHQEMINSLKVGRKVITNSGFKGIVRRVDDKNNEVDVEIADNVIVTMVKGYIADFTEEEKAKLAKSEGKISNKKTK